MILIRDYPEIHPVTFEVDPNVEVPIHTSKFAELYRSRITATKVRSALFQMFVFKHHPQLNMGTSEFDMTLTKSKLLNMEREFRTYTRTLQSYPTNVYGKMLYLYLTKYRSDFTNQANFKSYSSVSRINKDFIVTQLFLKYFCNFWDFWDNPNNSELLRKLTISLSKTDELSIKDLYAVCARMHAINYSKFIGLLESGSYKHEILWFKPLAGKRYMAFLRKFVDCMSSSDYGVRSK